MVLFLGEVVAVEYDSEDVDKNEVIFVVEDGDREDMNKEEVAYANEFYIQVSGIEDATPEGSLHTESGEEESYRPSPPVSYLFRLSSSYVLISSLTPNVEEKKTEEVSRERLTTSRSTNVANASKVSSS
jgi:hypothetical protein